MADMFYLFYLLVHFLTRQFRSLPVPSTSYSRRTVIVTGANVGLGREAARHFARLGAARVILACRSTDLGVAAKVDIEKTTDCTSVEVWPLDLSSFESVREFCQRADRELDRLDVLLANAAVAMVDVTVAEGYETTITVNVVSTFLMVLMLLPLLKRTAKRFNVAPTVTVVASEAHFYTKFVEKDLPRIFEGFRGAGPAWNDRYGTSKLLDVLVVRELARRLDTCHGGNSPIVVNCANPGLCKTSLFRNVPFYIQSVLDMAIFFIGRTSEEGSRTLMAAAAAGRESHGQYVDSGKVDDPSPFVLSEKGTTAQKRVWDELMGILEGIEPLVSGNVGMPKISADTGVSNEV